MDLRYRIYYALRKLSCPFREIDKIIPEEGKILDLGCGFGASALFFSISGAHRKVAGLDCEAGRISIAKEYARTKNINNCVFLKGDILDCDYGGAYDCILLVDVLYQLELKEKAKVIEKCYNALNKDGSLIIKEIGRRPFWKLIFCLLQETVIARPIKLNKKRIALLEAAGAADILRKAGFKVDIRRIDKGYPYPHILFICRKQAR